MRRFNLMTGFLGSSKLTFIMYLALKKYKRDCRKYKWNKYVYPFLIEV